MATLQELMLRAQLLRQETAVDSISAERAGSIMYDTLAYINQMQLQDANPLLISKIYASVAAMEADSAPMSDLTGKPLRPGQVVCIVPDDETDPDYGMIYRYDGTTGGTSSWTAVGRIGDPYLEGYQYMGVATLTPTATDPGTPTQKVFYLASEPGTYTNFVDSGGNPLVVNKGEVAVLKYDSAWSNELSGAASLPLIRSNFPLISNVIDFNKVQVGKCLGKNTGVISNATNIYRVFTVYLAAGLYYIRTTYSGTQDAMWKYTDSTYGTPSQKIIGAAPIAGTIQLEAGYYAISWTSGNGVNLQTDEAIVSNNTANLRFIDTSGITDEQKALNLLVAENSRELDTIDFSTSSLRVFYETNGNATYLSSRQRTNIIPVSEGDKFIFKKYASQYQNVYGICALDSSKELVPASSVVNMNPFPPSGPNGLYTVPEGVAYLIFVYELSVENPYVYKLDSIDSKVNSPFFQVSELPFPRVYTDGISEFYVLPSVFAAADSMNFSAPPGGGPANSIYLQGFDSGGNDIFHARIYFSGQQINDGEVVTFVCNYSTIETVQVGDVLGYVIFRDIDYIKTNGSYGNTNDPSLRLSSKVALLSNSPLIAGYLNGNQPDNVEIVLPSKIYAVEGDTLQIFHSAVVRAANPYNYWIDVICAYGKAFRRYFEYTPTAAQVGTDVTLRYVVRNSGNSVVAEKTVRLYVLSKISASAVAKNILILGDSLTAYGQMITELNRRLKLTTGDGTPLNPTGLGLTNVNFVGRKELDGLHFEATGGYSWGTYGTDAFKSIRYQVSGVDRLNLGDHYTIQGVSQSQTYDMIIREINVIGGSGNILCEVYGGYVYPEGAIPASGNLLIKSGYTGDATIAYSSFTVEPGNPFWNKATDKLDFLNYSALYLNNAPIDIIVTNLGTNGLNRDQDIAPTIDIIKTILRQFHEDYPYGKFIVNTVNLTGALGPYAMTSFGARYDVISVHAEYYKELQKLADSAEFSGFVSIMNLAGEFDCEYSFRDEMKNANNRVSSQQELVGLENTHPSDAGYKQFADSFYRAITSAM